MIIRQDVAEKLNDHLHHRLGLDEIVSWAEAAMMEEDFDSSDFDNIREIVARIGLAFFRSSFEPYQSRGNHSKGTMTVRPSTRSTLSASSLRLTD